MWTGICFWWFEPCVVPIVVAAVVSFFMALIRCSRCACTGLVVRKAFWIFIYIRGLLLIVSFLLSFSEEAVVGNSETVEILKEYYIPDYILLPDSEIEQQSEVPECPLIVFINSKSGGQLGGNLLLTCRRLLNKNQVCFQFWLHNTYIERTWENLSVDTFALRKF